MSLDELMSELKHLQGQHPQKAHAGAKSSADIEEAVSEVSSLKRSLRKQYRAASSNNLTVKAAKQVGKEKKIKFQELLKNFDPSDNLSGDVTWDKEGNLGKVR